MNTIALPAAGVPDARSDLLRRRKMIAAALLVVAGGVLVAARVAQHSYSHWSLGLVAAMAEAALVGGLADWFAVVALFRHPLGQRWVPHTAIIPTRKDGIGESLADFVCNHFLGREQVAEKLRDVDIGGALARKLADPVVGRKVGQAVARGMSRLLGVLSSDRLLGFIHELSREKLRSVDLSDLAAKGIERFTADGRHQELVTDLLQFLSEKLESPEMKEQIKERVKGEVGRVLSWLGADSYAADKLITGGIKLIAEMAQNPNHEVRLHVEEKVQDLVARLRADGKLRKDIESYRDRMIDDQEFYEYLRALLLDVTRWVEQDAARDDSVVAQRVAAGITELGARLLQDQDMRGWISEGVRETVEPMIEEHRETIRAFIVDRIHRWSAEEMTRELELSVGSDLQFIRYNGTAVGALIGGLIFAVLHLSSSLV